MTAKYHEMMKNKTYLPFRLGYMTDAIKKKAEEELGETEESKAQAIPELRRLVENEPKLKCPTDDDYLLQFLRARKFNVKRAFQLVQNYYYIKKSYSELYDDVDLDAVKRANATKTVSCLPYRDEDGCVIYLIQIKNWDPDQIPIQVALVTITINILFCIEDVATQVCGVRIMLDVQGVSLKQISCLTPRYMNLFAKGLKNCLHCRFKGIHMYNESVIFGYFWSVFKFFLSEKIQKRVCFHGDKQKHLHKFIPKPILPSEYGGDNTHFNESDWYVQEIETNFFDRYRKLVKYGYRD